MWRHNHVHEFKEEYLQGFMTQNKLFSDVFFLLIIKLILNFFKNMKLNISLGYAVSPLHTGVYPIYDPLYNSWRKIWNITVTSTEVVIIKKNKFLLVYTFYFFNILNKTIEFRNIPILIQQLVVELLFIII